MCILQTLSRGVYQRYISIMVVVLMTIMILKCHDSRSNGVEEKFKEIRSFSVGLIPILLSFNWHTSDSKGCSFVRHIWNRNVKPTTLENKESVRKLSGTNIYLELILFHTLFQVKLFILNKKSLFLELLRDLRPPTLELCNSLY